MAIQEPDIYDLKLIILKGNQVYFTAIQLTHESCSSPLEAKRKIGYYLKHQVSF